MDGVVQGVRGSSLAGGISFEEAQSQVPEKCLNKARFEELILGANKGTVSDVVKCLGAFSNIEHLSDESGMQDAKRLVELGHITKEGSWEDYCLAWMEIALAHKEGKLGLSQDVDKFKRCEDLVVDTLHGFLEQKGVKEARGLLFAIHSKIDAKDLDFTFRWMEGLIHLKEGGFESAIDDFVAAYLQNDLSAADWLRTEVENFKKLGTQKTAELMCDLVINKIITARNKQVSNAVFAEHTKLSASKDNAKILAFNVLTKLSVAKNEAAPAVDRLHAALYVMEHYPVKTSEMVDVLTKFLRSDTVGADAKLGAANELYGRSPALRGEVLAVLERLANGPKTPLGQKLGAAMTLADKVPEKKEAMLRMCLSLNNLIPIGAAAAKLQIVSDVLDRDQELSLKNELIEAYSALLKCADPSVVVGAAGKICSILPESKDQLGSNLLPYISSEKFSGKIRIVLADKMLKEMDPSPAIRSQIEGHLLSIAKGPNTEVVAKIKALNIMLKNPRLDASFKEDILAVCKECLTKDDSLASHTAWYIAINFLRAYGNTEAIDILNEANVHKEHGFAIALDRGREDAVAYMIEALGYDISWVDPHSKIPVLVSAYKSDNADELLEVINLRASTGQLEKANHDIELLRLGHVFSVNGHPTRENFGFSGNTERETILWVTQAIEQFLPVDDFVTQEDKDGIVKAFEQAVPLSKKSGLEIAQQVREGGIHFLPVSIQGNSSGTATHAVGLLFGNGYAVKVNRGDHAYANYVETLLRKEQSGENDIPVVHGLEFFKMDDSFFNEYLMSRLTSAEPSTRTKAWEAINHRNLDCYGRVDKKGQSMGNCTYASPKTGVLGALALTGLKGVDLSLEENPQWALTHIVYQKADKPYKAVAMGERGADLKAYQEKYKGIDLYDEAAVTVFSIKLLNLAYKNYDAQVVQTMMEAGDLPDIAELSKTITAHRADYKLGPHIKGITSLDLIRVLDGVGVVRED